MIKQITDEKQIISDKISNDHYGRRFQSLLTAYGIGYDFCRFYEIAQDENTAYFVILNSSMTISSNDEVDVGELELFINMHEIFSIEMPILLAKKMNLTEYTSTERTLFEFTKGNFSEDMYVNENPKLDDVFKILSTGFPLENCYELWLTDTSHQVRHGVSKIFLYKNTTATMYYNINGVAFFGQIATLLENRGKGYAREMLYWLEETMSKNGINAQLFAKPERVSFYISIGFKQIDTDLIFERII